MKASASKSAMAAKVDDFMQSLDAINVGPKSSEDYETACDRFFDDMRQHISKTYGKGIDEVSAKARRKARNQALWAEAARSGKFPTQSCVATEFRTIYKSSHEHCRDGGEPYES